MLIGLNVSTRVTPSCGRKGDGCACGHVERRPTNNNYSPPPFAGVNSRSARGCRRGDGQCGLSSCDHSRGKVIPEWETCLIGCCGDWARAVTRNGIDECLDQIADAKRASVGLTRSTPSHHNRLAPCRAHCSCRLSGPTLRATIAFGRHTAVRALAPRATFGPDLRREFRLSSHK